MPGTLGGAEIIFREDTTHNYTVNLDVRLVLGVEAGSMDEALAKAKHWQKTAKLNWGDGESVYWLDTYLSKESVEREINEL